MSSKPTIHFISGMPRSGSTLLAAILSQNSDIHVTPTHIAVDLLSDFRQGWQAYQTSHSINRARAVNVMRAMFYALHNGLGDTIINKNRGWLGQIQLIEELIERPAKILVTTRGIPEILHSYDKLYLKNRSSGTVPQELYSASQDERHQWYLSNCPEITMTQRLINRAVELGLSDRLHMISYNDLVREPKRILSSVCEFLGLDVFPYGFCTVPQYTLEPSPTSWMDGCHNVGRIVRKNG